MPRPDLLFALPTGTEIRWIVPAEKAAFDNNAVGFAGRLSGDGPDDLDGRRACG